MHSKKKNKRKLVQSFGIALLQLNQPTAGHYRTPAECRMWGRGSCWALNMDKTDKNPARPVPSGETDVKVIKDQVARIKAGKCAEKNHTMITRDLARTRRLHKGYPPSSSPPPALAKSTAVKTSAIAITFVEKDLLYQRLTPECLFSNPPLPPSPYVTHSS